MKRLKNFLAQLATALGVESPLTDAYLFVRSGQWKHGDAAVSDGAVPLPPPSLRYSSAGTAGDVWFLETGRAGAELVRELLADERPAKSDSEERERPRILDFGCGCGRVLRHLDPEQASIHGVDWNRRVVRWCRKHLPAVQFEVGGLEPPLAFGGDLRFRMIYAFSVFTHLPDSVQRAWLRELASRLEPGGILVLSTHGQGFVDQLSDDERRDYAAGRLVVRRPVVAGTNVCAAYHPPGALESLLPSTLSIVEHRNRGATGNPPQDLWIMRRA